MRTCQNCPDRKIIVSEDGIFLCRSKCSDWKKRKINEQVIKKKKMREIDIENAHTERVIKTKSKLSNKWGKGNC